MRPHESTKKRRGGGRKGSHRAIQLQSVPQKGPETQLTFFCCCKVLRNQCPSTCTLISKSTDWYRGNLANFHQFLNFQWSFRSKDHWTLTSENFLRAVFVSCPREPSMHTHTHSHSHTNSLSLSHAHSLTHTRMHVYMYIHVYITNILTHTISVSSPREPSSLYSTFH